MPLFGPRIRQVRRGQDDPEYDKLFMLTVFGPILVWAAISSAPVWIPAVKVFLVNHPSIPASSFWAVVKAIARKKDPVKAGLEASLDVGAVTLITALVEDKMKFLSH